MHKFAYLYQPFFIGFKNLSQLVLIYSCSLCDHQRLTNYIREFRFEGVSCVSSSSSEQVFQEILDKRIWDTSLRGNSLYWYRPFSLCNKIVSFIVFTTHPKTHFLLESKTRSIKMERLGTNQRSRIRCASTT